ncbi:acyl-CoA dehydrogenase family protein [Streptomyces sp. NPDC059766]|uniref:acyl-CoA dehydrogenase family protein n=1 Tax=Streptomyces sp. NPDC059766 TaxID=3346940 RepID=UPI00365AB90C
MSDWLISNKDQRQLVPTLTKALQGGEPHRWTDGTGDLDALLERAATLGAFALVVPEEAGGGSWSDQPVLDAALATAMLGTDLAPLPIPELTAAAALLVACPASAERDELLGNHAAGEELCLLPFRVEDEHGDQVLPTLTEGRLSAARAAFVQIPGAAHLLVPVTRAGQTLLARLGLDELLPSATEPTSLDLTRRIRQVDLTGVGVPDERLLPIAEQEVLRATALGTALVCAEVVAGIDTLLRKAVEYSLTREAFGQVIASFQALKHLLADARMELEGAKAVTVAAVEAFAAGDAWAAEAASIAKAYVDERAVPLAMNCLQVFGGIGFAWEHELHLYLRRAAARCGALGTRAEHLRVIDDLHISEWEAAR